MKLIIAMIQPHKLPDVKKALDDAQVHLMTVTNVLGAGRQKGYEENFRGVKYEVNLLKKIRLEIAVNDDYLEPAISAITRAAKTGNIGDGKIFVVPLEEVVRIRTNERGKVAIG
jgi:nitrogen regulatory protein P-II 2